MTRTNIQGRTNKELLKALRPPVARFYPYDLHTHSLGSHDVCYGSRFLALPEELRIAVGTPSVGPTDSAATPPADTESLSSSISLPLSKEPADHKKHDQDVATPEFVAAFYKSLCDRRDALVVEESILPSDNWAIVGITDHDTAQFSTLLSQQAWSRRSTDRLIVLPGIELEVRFPVEVEGTSNTCPLHILCLFAPCTTASDIRLAINAAKPSTTPAWDFGVPIDVAELPPFIQGLRNHPTYPAVCIAAHVWSSKGISSEPKKLMLESLDADIARLEGELERAKADNDGSDERDIQSRLNKLIARSDDSDELHRTVLRLIGQCGFDGLQVRDQSHEAHYRRLHRFRDQHGRAVPIVCSDSHTPTGVFLSGDDIPYIKLNVETLSGGDPGAVFDEIRKRALR